MTKRSAQAKAATADKGREIKAWVIGSVIAIGGAWVASGALGQEDNIISHGYSTFGEVGRPADFEYYDYVNPDAPRGGEMSFALQGTFDHVNPWATQVGRPAALSSIGFERLMAAPADEVDVRYCYLCETIEYPEDKSYVIFHLREDVTFSDGTPMTARDIAMGHEISITQFTPSYVDVVSRMLPSTEIIDDYTIKFNFGDEFSPDDALSQATVTMALPAHWIEANPEFRFDEPQDQMPPGTGAYEVGSYDKGRNIVLTRVENFWGDDHPMNVGHNNFDSIRIEYFTDTTAAFEAFKAGEVFFRRESSSQSWATGYEFPAVDEGSVVLEEIPNGALPLASGFVFNMTSEKLADRRVRQALALMYNFEWTNDSLQYGLFAQRESFWQGTDLQAVGVPEGLELEYLEGVADLIDPSILTDEVTLPHEGGPRQLDRGNLRAASALLDEAGWIAGDDGMRRKDGVVLEIEFLSDDPVYDRLLLPYISNLERLGIEASYERLEPSNYNERTRLMEFDMIVDFYRNGLVEGEGLGQRYGSESATLDGEGAGNPFNPALYSHPAVDALIQNVVNAETMAEMQAAVRAIDRVMRYDMFMVPTWYQSNSWVARWDIYGRPETIPPFALGYYTFWWADAEAEQRLRDSGAIR